MTEHDEAPQKKPKQWVERYYSLTEDEMQALITGAKDRDGASQMQLLEVFGNFLNKYTTLLYYGKYNLKDYDVRRFVALFVKDSIVRMYLSKNKLDARGAKHVAECMRGIHYMVVRYGDEEDVRQTVNMAFFQCVDRYQRKGAIPFSAYLYSYYFFVLKKTVDQFLIDQLGRRTFPLIDQEDLDSQGEGEERHPGFVPPPVLGVEEFIHSEEVDEYWVAGDTAHPPFDRLTVQERQLLKWRYVDMVLDLNGTPRPMRSSDIAVRITEHPNTVREHFNRIKQRLKEYIEEDIGQFENL